MSKEEKARAFAIKAHKDQKYGDLPYSFHLQEVRDLLPHDASEEACCAAWLHDVVEDTVVTIGDIRKEFGGRIARIVDECTDESGKNRKERKEKTNEKLMYAHSDSKLVKLCDRIANMKASIENKELAKMYRKEFPNFIRAIGQNKVNFYLLIKAYKLYMNSVERELIKD